MFRIVTTTGVDLGLTEQVNYININSRNRCFNHCDEKSAIGIAFRGKPYNLYGHSEIPDTGTVVICKVDSGAELSAIRGNNIDLAQHLADLDEAMIEIYEMRGK